MICLSIVPGARVDLLALAEGDGPGSLVFVPSGDDAVGVRDDRAIVNKQVEVVFGGQQRADVSLQHEVWLTVRLIASMTSGSADALGSRRSRQSPRCQFGSASM